MLISYFNLLSGLTKLIIYLDGDYLNNLHFYV